MPSGVKRHPSRVEGRTIKGDVVDRAFRAKLDEGLKQR